MSKLNKNGCIPAHTVCPFKTKCVEDAEWECRHSGKEHKVDYSCGLARAFDIINESEKEDEASE